MRKYKFTFTLKSPTYVGFFVYWMMLRFFRELSKELLMKSYIKGIISGGMIVFLFFVFFWANKFQNYPRKMRICINLKVG